MSDSGTLPQTPQQLLEQLFAIFPQYRATYPGPTHDDTPTYHSVLIGFSCFLGSNGFTNAQLRSLAGLVNAALESGGPLANAFETCLLEHLHQIRSVKALRPYLSKAARESTKS